METVERHTVITGQMAVGKTTAANEVAARLGRAHRDSDEDIEAATGRTGRDIAATDGVDALHRLEADVLLRALGNEEPAVISAAASTIEHAECRKLMQERAFVVVLVAAPATLRSRALSADHRRDIRIEELEVLIARREDLFEQAADVTISAEQSSAAVADAIVAAYGEREEP